MLLVLDVGNSNIVLGVYKEEVLIRHWRMKTDKESTSDELGLFMVQLFKNSDLSIEEIKGIVVSSVVPPIMFSLERALNRYFNKKPLIVNTSLKLGIDIKVDNPKALGSDRIADAVGAYAKYNTGCIVVDFGTATKYEFITKEGQYLGGAITPGIKISADALFQRTSKLPRIEITKPDSIVGKNTVDAIQSGLYYGYVGQVEYIVAKMKKDFNVDEDAKVIATGGLAALISNEAQCIDVLDTTLTLDGLRIIYELNKEGEKS